MYKDRFKQVTFLELTKFGTSVCICELVEGVKSAEISCVPWIFAEGEPYVVPKYTG